jgi:capsular exopolysaccharide synthesis family protein
MSAHISNPGKEWELGDYMGALRRRAALVVGATVVVAALAGAFALVQSKQYEATAQVLIERQASDQVFTNGNPVFDPKRDIQTEVKVLQSAAVQHAAIARIGHAPDVTISSDETSNVIGVVARAPSPDRAASDANEYAQTYVRYRREQAVSDLGAAGREVQSRINEIDDRLAQLPASSPERGALGDQRSYLVQQLSRMQVSANLSGAGGASVIAKAQAPGVPVGPSPVRNALIGGAIGMLVGIALALLLEFFDDGVRDRARLEEVLEGNVPVLAEIPFVPAWKNKDGRVASALVPWSPASEAFGTLRASLLSLGSERGISTIQVTSPSGGEGSTTVASNLAVAIARTGRRVAVVGADLRRPRLHEFFGVANDVGLTSVLRDNMRLNDAVQWAMDESHIAVLAAGPQAPNPAELLSTPWMHGVIASLRQAADFVIVDTPPVLSVSDALVVAGLVDATILVASAQVSSRRTIQQAWHALDQVEVQLTGTVLNGADVEPTTHGQTRAGTARSGRTSLPAHATPETNGHRRAVEPLSR